MSVWMWLFAWPHGHLHTCVKTIFNCITIACTHMCIIMCVCTYVYLYMCECMHLWCVCVYVCVYMWMYVCLYICVYICMHICIWMGLVYVYIYIYIYIYMCVCVCLYVHIARYIYTQNFLLDLLYSISWLFILLCLIIIQFVDAEKQVEMFKEDFLSFSQNTFVYFV